MERHFCNLCSETLDRIAAAHVAIKTNSKENKFKIENLHQNKEIVDKYVSLYKLFKHSYYLAYFNNCHLNIYYANKSQTYFALQ